MEKGLVERNIKEEILEEQVDDCHEMENRELEEHQVNNAISESRIENPQYKLAQGNGKYSRERTIIIREKGIPAAREEIHKEETNKCNGFSKESRSKIFRSSRGVN